MNMPAWAVRPAGELHPYRSLSKPQEPSIESRAMHLANALANQHYRDRASVADSVEELLAAADFDDLRYYEIVRPVHDRFTGVSCTYFNHYDSVAMVERVVFPTTYADLDEHMQNGPFHRVFLFFMERAFDLRQNLDIFSGGQLLSTYAQEQVEEESWARMRSSYSSLIKHLSAEQISGQMLVRAINKVRGEQRCP